MKSQKGEIESIMSVTMNSYNKNITIQFACIKSYTMGGVGKS
jgi:hypothetical protein